MFFNNGVKTAVNKAGGPSRVAIELRCSGTTVHNWIRQGRVSNLDKAQKLAELANMDVLEIRPC
jgi:DNA invertase Pin-like site-specific DNA recombinase